MIGATADYNSTFQGSTVMYTCDAGSEYQSVDISLVCTGGVWTGAEVNCGLTGELSCMVIIGKQDR